ncbi:MAG: hypothetical protein V1913_01800, partial [Fibrobacterota bacterium]
MKILKLSQIFTILFAVSCFAQVDWTWRNPLPTNHDLYSIIYGNSQYVAVGERGTILTSSDGVIWRHRGFWTFDWLTSVSYGNGQYVAVGGMTDHGLIITSVDGVTWTNRSSGITNQLISIIYG